MRQSPFPFWAWLNSCSAHSLTWHEILLLQGRTEFSQLNSVLYTLSQSLSWSTDVVTSELHRLSEELKSLPPFFYRHERTFPEEEHSILMYSLWSTNLWQNRWKKSSSSSLLFLTPRTVCEVMTCLGFHRGSSSSSRLCTWASGLSLSSSWHKAQCMVCEWLHEWMSEWVNEWLIEWSL